MVAKRAVKPENIPPTASTAINHSLRVHQQTVTWKKTGSRHTRSTAMVLEGKRWEPSTCTNWEQNTAPFELIFPFSGVKFRCQSGQRCWARWQNIWYLSRINCGLNFSWNMLNRSWYFFWECTALTLYWPFWFFKPLWHWNFQEQIFISTSVWITYIQLPFL